MKTLQVLNRHISARGSQHPMGGYIRNMGDIDLSSGDDETDYTPIDTTSTGETTTTADTSSSDSSSSGISDAISNVAGSVSGSTLSNLFSSLFGGTKTTTASGTTVVKTGVSTSKILTYAAVAAVVGGVIYFATKED